MSMIQRNTTALGEWVNVWSLEKRLRPISKSIMLKDRTMKSTLMDLRLTRGLGQQRSSTAISRMVRRPVASCPRDSRITAPSLLLRLQPLPWHWTIIGTWTLYSTMFVFYSDSMSCLQAIEGEDIENPLICHIMNLLWALSDKGTCVRFCWVPSHFGIEGNEVVD